MALKWAALYCILKWMRQRTEAEPAFYREGQAKSRQEDTGEWEVRRRRPKRRAAGIFYLPRQLLGEKAGFSASACVLSASVLTLLFPGLILRYLQKPQKGLLVLPGG